MTKTYSLARDGNTKLSASFTVREFRCRDGSDKILIDDNLVSILQKIRDYFNAPITINSAYRNAAYNRKIGGASRSQHIQGTAADIVVQGVSPLKVAQYAEYLDAGGIGWYKTFTHVDTRAGKSRWNQTSGRQVVVATFGGQDQFQITEPPRREEEMTQEQFNQMMEEYLKIQAEEPAASWAAETWNKATRKGIFDGSKPFAGLTRQEAALVLDRLELLD